MILEWVAVAIVVVVLLSIAASVARALDRRIARREERDPTKVEPTELSRQRVRTVQRVLKGLLVAVVVVFGVGVAVQVLGIGDGPLVGIALITAVLAAFSGAAWGSDVVAGISIILEGQYYEGDWIEVKPHQIVGQVEGLSLRSTTLRGLDGSRWVIPNGEMRITGNLTYDRSRYLFHLRVSYEDDVDIAIETLEGVYGDIERDERLGQVVSRLRILGVDDYGSSGIDIKLYLETEAGQQWRVGREFRRRLKPALDAAGVHIPYEHRDVLLRWKGAEGDMTGDSGRTATEDRARDDPAEEPPPLG